MRSFLMLALLLGVILGIQPKFQVQAQTDSMHGNREVLIATSADAPPVALDAGRQAQGYEQAQFAQPVTPRKSAGSNLMDVVTTFAEGLSGGLALTILLAVAAITMPRVSWGLREARVA